MFINRLLFSIELNLLFLCPFQLIFKCSLFALSNVSVSSCYCSCINVLACSFMAHLNHYMNLISLLSLVCHYIHVTYIFDIWHYSMYHCCCMSSTWLCQQELVYLIIMAFLNTMIALLSVACCCRWNTVADRRWGEKPGGSVLPFYGVFIFILQKQSLQAKK